MPPETSSIPKLDRKTLTIGGVGVLIGLVLGLVIGQFLPSSSPKPASNTPNALVNQSATAQGKLVAVGNGKITLESDNGEKSVLLLSNEVNIFVYKDQTSPASASADLNVLELNKQVLVSLGAVGGEYQVTTITVLPPDSVSP